MSALFFYENQKGEIVELTAQTYVIIGVIVAVVAIIGILVAMYQFGFAGEKKVHRQAMKRQKVRDDMAKIIKSSEERLKAHGIPLDEDRGGPNRDVLDVYRNCSSMIRDGQRDPKKLVDMTHLLDQKTENITGISHKKWVENMRKEV